jgi:hypothetical protein
MPVLCGISEQNAFGCSKGKNFAIEITPAATKKNSLGIYRTDSYSSKKLARKNNAKMEHSKQPLRS